MQTAVYWTAWADVLPVRQLLLRSRRRGGGPEQPQASDAARPSLCADACASLFRGGGEPGCRAAWMRSAITMPHTNAAARWPNKPRLQQWLVHTPAAGIPAEDRRRLDFVLSGATRRGQALCCDVTLVSPWRADGRAIARLSKSHGAVKSRGR